MLDFWGVFEITTLSPLVAASMLFFLPSHDSSSDQGGGTRFSMMEGSI